MTLHNLKALLAIITDAINDIDRVFNSLPPSTTLPDSPNSIPPLPPTPTSPTTPKTTLDFPELDAPHSPSSPEESLTTHPVVVGAIAKIVAACGQMTCTVQNPFLTLCDASMSVSHLDLSFYFPSLTYASTTFRHVFASWKPPTP